jgi:hypothetical protein
MPGIMIYPLLNSLCQATGQRAVAWPLDHLTVPPYNIYCSCEGAGGVGEIDIDVTSNKQICNPNIIVIRLCILE